jgi:hypothetical protein
MQILPISTKKMKIERRDSQPVKEAIISNNAVNPNILNAVFMAGIISQRR